MEESPERRSKWGVIDLREIEETVDAEARKWAKNRKEEILREKAAAFSPGRPEGAKSRPTPGVED
jgi:hypothetical protein